MSIPINPGQSAPRGACSIKKTKQTGLTLIELIIFIVIIGLSVAGVMVTYSTVVGQSADPVIRKQALAIADSLLLEIEQMGFTYCDSSDANFQTALQWQGCTSGLSQNTPGPVPSSQTRGSFDNVGDYHGYRVGPLYNLGSGVPDITGGNIINGYSAIVTVAQQIGAPFTTNGLPGGGVQGDTLKITVTVTGPGNLRITLVGYRARYAPNSL